MDPFGLKEDPKGRPTGRSDPGPSGQYFKLETTRSSTGKKDEKNKDKTRKRKDK